MYFVSYTCFAVSGIYMLLIKRFKGNLCSNKQECNFCETRKRNLRNVHTVVAMLTYREINLCSDFATGLADS